MGKEVPKEKVYEVVSPLSKVGLEVISLAPPLADLNGKTVCEIWNHRFRGEVTFPKMRELLKKQFPDVKIVPYTEFHYSGNIALASTTVEEVKKYKCDAIIGGNGG